MTEQQPKLHDAVLGGKEPLQVLREDIEFVLRQIELGDLMGIFYQARAIANRQRRGQTPSKPSLRLLVGLMDAFEERYPHFLRRTF